MTVTEELATAAAEAVARVRHLARLPESASVVARRAQDPECLPDELAVAFAADPVLASQLLKVANSAYYGLRAQVSSIAHAANLLGRIRLRNIALASSLGPLLHSRPVHPSFSPRTLWHHSIAVAAAARQVALETGADDPEEAFAAGLVHDLGLVVLIQDRRNELATFLDRLSDRGSLTRSEVRDLEREAFGADHALLGAALCRSWGFPESLIECTAWHHDPLHAPPGSRTLAALVHVGDAWSDGTEQGGSTSIDVDRIAEPDDEVLALVGLDAHRGERLRAAVADAVREVLAAFTS
jgi:putative nucleotidyltransferase with HDIG domain